MTNAEAFKKVFGFAPRVMNQNEKTDGCFIPISVCNDFNSCKECPFVGFWDKEYKPCFKLKGGYDEP